MTHESECDYARRNYVPLSPYGVTLFTKGLMPPLSVVDLARSITHSRSGGGLGIGPLLALCGKLYHRSVDTQRVCSLRMDMIERLIL